jgi:phosphoglycerate dehydrogenase-like enzyme
MSLISAEQPRSPIVPLVTVAPDHVRQYSDSVAETGGRVVDLNADTNCIIWTDSSNPQELLEVLKRYHQIRWVQLPFAGVENFADVFRYCIDAGLEVVFTSAKGAYREPVAEHALMLALALARALPERIQAKTWGRKFAASLYDSRVVIVGAGGIATELVRLLAPFRAQISIIRRGNEPVPGTTAARPLNQLQFELPDADFVFVAAALTPETNGLFNSDLFQLMKPSAYFVNIARGGLVVSHDLLMALLNGSIAGAGIDVTDPEPLPDGHELWNAPNLIITPHTADTPEMCVRLLSGRIRKNTRALINGEPLEGLVNLKLGY